jgi:5-methylcytosine-specific restriction endonuclease McrA
LSAVVLLAPHLTPENAAELIAVAAHRTKAEIETLLAARFPKPDLPTLVMAVAPACPADREVQVAVCESGEQHAPGHVDGDDARLVPEPVGPVAPRARVTPLAPQRFALQFTVGQEAHDLLNHAQELLGHAVPSGDVGEVFLRALRVFVKELEKRKFAATDRPRPGQRRRPEDPRSIPAGVQRAVWQRDGGRCTFVSDSGHRCEERSSLQFDHVVPVACGGQASVEGLRLLCLAHNQHAAERAFGKGFMDEKRQEARRQAAEVKAQKAAAAVAKASERAAADAELAAASDVIPGLKILGYRGDELRYAATLAAAIPDASTAVRMHHVIKGLGRASMSRLTHGARNPV